MMKESPIIIEEKTGEYALFKNTYLYEFINSCRIGEEILQLNKKYMNEIDNFDFWEQHVKYVVKEALLLAEVVEEAFYYMILR